MRDVLRESMSPARPLKGPVLEYNREEREARIRAQAERVRQEMAERGLVYGTMREEKL